MSGRVAPATLVPRLLLGTAPDARLLHVDGTALVVDISGFTVLSERLAAAGRRGTEELIATLSRVFTVLLSATDDGGDVVKFAGDALIVLYTGDEHARRAAHSAWIMQRVLAAIGDIRLPSAATRLRMSAGLHSGTFDLALTGAATRNAVLAGADAWRVLELQSAARAGTVLVSAETARRLPARRVSGDEAAPGAHRLLGAGAVASDSLMALHAVERTNAERFLPEAFAERPDLLDADPDHRWAAAGFVLVEGLPDRLDDAAADSIDDVTRVVERAVAGTGATLLDIDAAGGGYRYFLTAGAPRTLEDPEGSLLAALDEIVREPLPFAVRAGAASGRLFAGFVGSPARQTYTTMGDATNLAARLTARALPGSLLVPREMSARAGSRIVLCDETTITVKGKARGIEVGVVAEIGVRRADRGDLPFFGRIDETSQVERAQAVVVTGPAGIGKSRLVDHARAGAPEVRVQGDRFAVRTAYGTMRRLVRPLLDIDERAASGEAGRELERALRAHAPELSTWAALVADVIGAEVRPSRAVRDLDDEFRAERTRAVLRELLGEVLPAGAAVVVDDAQWVDAASADAFADALPIDGHALIVCRRDDPGGLLPEHEPLALAGLPDDVAAELVEAVAGHALLPSALASVLERAGGNPLYLIELAGSARSGDDPRALEQLIGERIDALVEQDRHLVREAAVLGTRVPRALFERCLGPADRAPGDFLEVSDEQVAFRSDLYREVAYEQLSFHQRRRLHRAAAEAIAADPTVAGGSADAMLAVHHEAVCDWAAAAAAARRSGASAERAHALEDAVGAYRTAAHSARRAHADPAELRGLWESLGRVCLGCGRNGDALEAYDAARALARDAATRARIDRQRAYALNLLGRPAEATAALRRARRNAKAAGGRGLEASIVVTEAAMRLRQARWRDLRRLSLEVIALLAGGAEDGEEKAALADAYRYHDIAASELEGDAAMVHLQQALDLYEDLEDAKSKSKVLSLIGVRAYHRGAWSSAAGLYAQAQDAAEAAGDAVGAAIESANAAEILIDQGRIDEARPLLRRARRVFAAVDDAYLVAYVTAFGGRAHLRAGDVDAACDEFADAAAAFEELGEVESVLDARVRRVEALLRQGDADAARAAVSALAAHPDLAGPTLAILLRSQARLALFDAEPGRAADLLRSATDAAGAALFERALCLSALSALGGSGSALLRAEAETILSGLGVVDIPRLLDGAPEADPPAALRPPPEREASR